MLFLVGYEHQLLKINNIPFNNRTFFWYYEANEYEDLYKQQNSVFKSRQIIAVPRIERSY